MSKEQRWKVGRGPAIVLIVLLPLWAEFYIPGATLWNAVLFVLLAGFCVGAIFIHRHLMKDISQIGEARFNTHDK